MKNKDMSLEITFQIHFSQHWIHSPKPIKQTTGGDRSPQHRQLYISLDILTSPDPFWAVFLFQKATGISQHPSPPPKHSQEWQSQGQLEQQHRSGRFLHHPITAGNTCPGSVSAQAIRVWNTR